MRDKNIYIRNETAFSCLFGNGAPVFAYVVGTYEEDGEIVVMYRVDYPVRNKRKFRWFYRDNEKPIEGGEYVIRDSGTHTARLSHFQKLFRPDVFDVYGDFNREQPCAA